ncbi:MAG: hypothetical protein E7554_09580 [Ruminococcaceae bacterium]|nr:hypothetical protein [Oscillospiraceae bacterium]
MKKRMNSGLRALLASILIIITVMSLSGCLFNAPPEDPNAPKPIPMDQLSEDDRAAADALIKYFDAYSAKDVETMADSLCSDCRLRQLNEANGATRDNFVELMKGNVSATDAEFGENAKMMYDKDTMTVTNADEYVETLNEEFRIDTANEPAVDMARIVTATVWFEVAFGNQEGTETGSMLVYRYNNEWFVYGYAG